MDNQKVKLILSDAEIIEVDRDIAERSVLIKGMLDDNIDGEEIPLPNLKKAVMDKIIVFCIHLRDN